MEKPVSCNCNAKTLPDAAEKYANIMLKISFYIEPDDNILMDKKLKLIVDQFTKDCCDIEEVIDAVQTIHDKCLEDEEFSSKVITMVASQEFKTCSVHEIELHDLFFTQFRNDYDFCEETQKDTPVCFRGIVRMFGDFYHKARLSNEQPYKSWSGVMLKYLNLLLESHTEDDLQLFTTMLHMNGKNIRDNVPSKFTDLLNQIRDLLALDNTLSKTSKLWLMMAIDISNNKFNFMSNELHQFYMNHLGEKAMKDIKKMTNEMSIQTNYQNKILDSFQKQYELVERNKKKYRDFRITHVYNFKA